ncbi:MAG: AAA family ATPase, partial [Dolichospermum sp.]
MKIESIHLKNFKSFKNVEIKKIPKMCVFVGANGTGKTTLFNVFSFLKDALTDNVHVALTKLGGGRGFQEVRSRNSTGPIEIELKFRLADKSPLITYSLKINEEDGRPIIEREILQYQES